MTSAQERERGQRHDFVLQRDICIRVTLPSYNLNPVLISSHQSSISLMVRSLLSVHPHPSQGCLLSLYYPLYLLHYTTRAPFFRVLVWREGLNPLFLAPLHYFIHLHSHFYFTSSKSKLDYHTISKHSVVLSLWKWDHDWGAGVGKTTAPAPSLCFVLFGWCCLMNDFYAVYFKFPPTLYIFLLEKGNIVHK